MSLKDQIMELQRRLNKMLTELSLNALAIKKAAAQHLYPSTIMLRQEILMEDILVHQNAIEMLRDRIDGVSAPLTAFDLMHNAVAHDQLLYSRDPEGFDEDPEAPLWDLVPEVPLCEVNTRLFRFSGFAA